ncbi:MAG: hypothetical protein H6719_35935 [Sandaracinaceae bacterium]|nr:hypothetical protein [Sandaracinaceae bacterium]
MHRLVSVSLVLVLGLALVACDGDTPSDTDAGGGGTDAGGGGTDAGTDAGPAETDAGTDAGAEDAGPTDAGADAALPPGACTNADDAMALGMVDTAMEAERCGTMCFGGAMCVTMCMEMLGISNECATCFGEVANCAARMCALPCARGASTMCTDCRRMMGCSGAFETCSGLPGS